MKNSYKRSPELMGSHQGVLGPSWICSASGFPALLPKRDSSEGALWYPPDNSSGKDSWGDHGMNQRLRTLSCFLILAVLAVCSTDAVARGSGKPQQAKKPQEATGVRHHRNAALTKARFAKHV